MRAVRVHELTGPSALRVDELPDLKATAGQVVIEVRAAGVNFPDILQTRGTYQFKPNPPFSPGGEVAGVVKEIGDGVRSVAVGDRVAATMIYGGYAEQVMVPEVACIKLP